MSKNTDQNSILTGINKIIGRHLKFETENVFEIIVQTNDDLLESPNIPKHQPEQEDERVKKRWRDVSEELDVVDESDEEIKRIFRY